MDFDEAMKKEKELTDISMAQSKRNKEERLKKKTCPCGRSPIGLCIGWHALSESEYQIKLNAWNEHHNKKEK